MELISREAVLRSMTGLANSHRLTGEFGLTEAVFDRIRALPAQAPAVKVKPLEWVKSHIKPWSEDWHTASTGYTIRCADEWGWRWSNSVGTHGHERNPEAAKAAAQKDFEARVISALDM